MQLSVIIVNYNVKYFLEQCLHSVIKACAGMQAQIIVADNNSTDGSRAYLEEKFTGVQFIWNSDNIGFARANNQALEKAKGEFVLFLNPDTLLAEDSIEKCMQFFKTNKAAGALGIRMVDGSGNFLKESKRAFPSPLTSLFKLSGLARLFPRSKTFARYHLGHLPEHENHEVDVLAGAFMMIPKKILDEIGNFDERFFMYGEDVDLSYRIQEAGYKNYYFAESSIIHFKGESTKRGSLNYVRLFYKAMNLCKKTLQRKQGGVFYFPDTGSNHHQGFLFGTGEPFKKNRPAHTGCLSDIRRIWNNQNTLELFYKAGSKLFAPCFVNCISGFYRFVFTYRIL
jgi:O-antigen biosynthesis protein